MYCRLLFKIYHYTFKWVRQVRHIFFQESRINSPKIPLGPSHSAFLTYWQTLADTWREITYHVICTRFLDHRASARASDTPALAEM